MSCFGKLFTIIINERLKKWALENNIILNAQFGFKADYSTVDAIFILESLINKSIREKKRLYCAYIDLKRAFDSVYRNGLWYKMIKNGLDGKLFDIIRSIYSDVKSCVKILIPFPIFFQIRCRVITGRSVLPFFILFFC